MHVDSHQTEAELDRLIAREKHAVRAKRLRAVRRALAGLDVPTVAERTGSSRRSVQTRAARYNAAGRPGLADAAGRGGKPPLDAGPEARFRARVGAGPTPADGVAALRGEDFRRVLTGGIRCRPVARGGVPPPPPPRVLVPHPLVIGIRKGLSRRVGG